MKKRALLTHLIFSVAATTLANAADTPASSQTSLAITDEMLGARHPPAKLTKRSEDPTYGYTSERPVVVGGGFAGGKAATYSYLNALTGPEGQKVHYKRLGTCCSFETPNSPFGDTALLEFFEISYEGLAEPRKLYFNWYDAADPQIPVGLDTVPPEKAEQE
ncbi:MAG: hypothetical protein AMXMBFR36_30730 [Acidobacteriota bacterium]